jgi:hypothetical protein
VGAHLVYVGVDQELVRVLDVAQTDRLQLVHLVSVDMQLE